MIPNTSLASTGEASKRLPVTQRYMVEPDNAERIDAVEIKEQFKAWWMALALKGDPQRRPKLVEEAFVAGYERGRVDAMDQLESGQPLLADVFTEAS